MQGIETFPSNYTLGTIRKAAQLGGIGSVEGGRRWKRVGWTGIGEKGRGKQRGFTKK